MYSVAKNLSKCEKQITKRHRPKDRRCKLDKMISPLPNKQIIDRAGQTKTRKQQDKEFEMKVTIEHNHKIPSFFEATPLPLLVPLSFFDSITIEDCE